MTGEYFVLGGSLALATPVRFGQQIKISKGKISNQIHWTSLEPDGSVWFSAKISLSNFSILETSDLATAERVLQILRAIEQAKPTFFLTQNALEIFTQTDFPRNWGLGTSSTLIAGLAKFAGIDPFFLLEKTFGGSGYDVACAFSDGPILYKIENGKPDFYVVKFDPPFSKNLYFVYLGKKMDSREGIKIYREKINGDNKTNNEINKLTSDFLKSKNLKEIENVMKKHENLISDALNLEKVKDRFFPDFWGAVKSLGAWGGDFVLATSEKPEAETRKYFNEKGFEVFFSFSEMVKK